VFTLDGKYLAFLSVRTFDPVYDTHVFDMSFPAGTRPYLLALAATTPSPFDAELGGRPRSTGDQHGTAGAGGAGAGAAGAGAAAGGPSAATESAGAGGAGEAAGTGGGGAPQGGGGGPCATGR